MPRPKKKQNKQCGKCFKDIKAGDFIIPIERVDEVYDEGATMLAPNHDLPGAIHVDCDYPDITQNPEFALTNNKESTDD